MQQYGNDAGFDINHFTAQEWQGLGQKGQKEWRDLHEKRMAEYRESRRSSGVLPEHEMENVHSDAMEQGDEDVDMDPEEEGEGESGFTAVNRS
jgi:hypothetical protein